MGTRRLRLPAIAAAAALALPAVALGHELLDHPVPSRSNPTPPSPAFQSGGPGAKWESMGSIVTGNPHTDLDFFTAKGETFAAVGTLGTGPNGGGVTIVKLLDAQGKPASALVSGHPSASCVSNPEAALGLQHDIEVTPKPAASLNTANAFAKLGDAQLIVDATDAEGRCHDQGLGGLPNPGVPGAPAAPQGGLEIIDITEGPDKPKEIGLTSHIGEAHTVNIDPKRPHIAYAVTSDGISVDAEGKRANDSATGGGLDGFEVVDLSSCMNFPATARLEDKRAACRPQVYRYRWPSAQFAQGHSADDASGASRGVYGCHELEIYPDDRLTCAAGAVSLLFDMKGAFDDMGTPNDFTDDKPRGTPLPCSVRDSSSAVPQLKTGAKVTDCVTGTDGTKAVDLRVANWKAIGAPSLEGVVHLGTARHIGRAATNQTAKFDSTQDIDFSHETELTHSGRYMFSSDERGGGVAPPGAACDQPDQNKLGNGGLHFYDVTKLQKDYTGNEKVAWQAYALRPDGKKAIYRAPIRTGAQATICTSHVFQQIPGQNRIFMGWYSQGTQVVDFTENADGTLDFKEAGYFIPAGANEWVSHVYRTERNADGTFTYFGAAADFNLGEGRSAIDLYKVTLPAPPAPRVDGQSTATVSPAQQGPANQAIVQGAAQNACIASARLRDVAARGGRKSVRVDFDAGSRVVDATIRRVSTGTRVNKQPRTVARFRGKRDSFTWTPKRAQAGAYVLKVKARGTTSVRRVAVLYDGERFFALGDIDRRNRCDDVRRLGLRNPAFGGSRGAPLVIAARTAKSGTMGVSLLRGGKAVRAVGPTVLTNRSTERVLLPAKGLPRGFYQVRIKLQLGDVQETVTLRAARL